VLERLEREGFSVLRCPRTADWVVEREGVLVRGSDLNVVGREALATLYEPTGATG
jgi:hypothetical protein